MRRVLLLVVVALLGSVLFVVARPASTLAASCNDWVTTCGYFTDRSAHADWNVLPDPALQYLEQQSNKTDYFIGAINWYLNTSSDYHATVGAAFIVDTMLGYRGGVSAPAGGGQSAGIAYAKAHFSSDWMPLVYTYANSTNPASYGIKWSLTPSEQSFCSGRIDSGYDPTLRDAALYHTPTSVNWLCSIEYNGSMPEIHFYWPGGSFDIGTLCGNVQDSAQAIPSPNHRPTGTISTSCATGSEVVTVNFSDLDGSTSGYIKITNAGTTHQSSRVNSGSSQQITLQPSWYSPAGGQAVSLWVTDVGTLGNGDVHVASANTAACLVLNCGSLTTTPSYVDPAMKFAVTVSATASGASGSGTMQLTIPFVPGGTQSQTVAPGGTTYTTTFTNIGPTNATGVFTAHWTLTVGAASSGPCSGTFSVVNLPYLNVYGGDIAVGASPTYSGGASTCVSNSAAGAFSWNNHTTDFSGAGAQYAVEALAQIEDVASALNSSNTAPIGLSFANTYTPPDGSKLDTAQGLFGGSFGATTNDCDFTTNIGVAPVKTDTTVGSGGVTTVGVGTTSTTYVMNADVYISNNVAYVGTGGWAGARQIPSFKLVVVGGNIYINNAVTQLDGLYVSEPSGGKGGTIYTCATAIRAPVDLSVAGSYATCKHQLVVNGAFVAKQVQFGRTFGTVGNAKPTDTASSNSDAEVFNYTPELWLPRGNTPPGTGYATITGLPPVL